MCKECGRGFKTSADLTRHSNVHSKQMTFVCDVEGCAKSYTRRDGVTLHKKTVQCGNCSKLHFDMLSKSPSSSCKFIALEIGPSVAVQAVHCSRVTQ